jgi:hypothetical protein
MPEYNAAYVPVLCRDCRQPMAVIQQEDLDGRYLIQVTCWQPNCLLHGFTLSLERYTSLNDFQFEAYREINRIYPPQYVRVEEMDRVGVQRGFLLNSSQKEIPIVHKLSEVSFIIRSICSLNREIIKCNQKINRLRDDLFAIVDIDTLEFQKRTLQQKVFFLTEEYQVVVSEIKRMRQERLAYKQMPYADYYGGFMIDA